MKILKDYEIYCSKNIAARTSGIGSNCSKLKGSQVVSKKGN
jgi:hypothetical protein